MNGLEFRRALRGDLKNRFTSVGCYPVALLMADGGVLCWKCAHEEKAAICLSAMTGAHDGWKPECVFVNWEEPDLYCDHCNERIESAYAEGESPHTEPGPGDDDYTL